MAKKRSKNNENEITGQPSEIRKKIETVLEAKGIELEEVAQNMDPDFQNEDYAQEFAPEVAEEESPDEEAEEDASEAAPEFVLPEAEVSPSRYPKPASERYQPKTGLGRYFLRNRHNMAFGVMLMMMAAATVWQALDYYIPETVNVTYKTLKKTQELQLKTRTRTVGEFIQELKGQGIKVTDKDAVNYPDDRIIQDDMELVVAKVENSSARVAGKSMDILMIPGTVKENLEFNEIDYDKNDVVKPALDSNVSKKTRIVVDEVHYVTKDKTEKVEAESKVILDPSLTSGVQQTKEGNDGKGVFTYKYKYVNGKKVRTDRKVKKWIKKPHNHELRLGTSATGQSGTFMVARTFIANTTAYTAHAGARGSLGEPVHVGTCAVDPSFVSYRSQMWIEGYGYAYANDCGGAVRGNIVDLYMNSTSACIQWGRRNVTAYVLVPAE